MTHIISLDAASRILAAAIGDDVRICLEPRDVLLAKRQADKLDELWVLNPQTGVMGRGDGKFFQVEYVDRGTHGQLAIREEPGAPRGTSAVGHVIVQVNNKGQVRVRRVQGLNGEVLELHPSSLSKGEPLPTKSEAAGFFETNPQRIIGTIDAILVHEEFPEEEAMGISDFIDQSTDGRSLAALVALGLVFEPSDY